MILAIGTWVQVYRRFMTKTRPAVAGTWVPDACTLPTDQQPLRVAEFDELFAFGVSEINRVAVSQARFELRPDPAVAGMAANLAVRETDCCSFFEFTQTASGGRLTLVVTVPTEHAAVLDAVVNRARCAAGLAS